MPTMPCPLQPKLKRSVASEIDNKNIVNENIIKKILKKYDKLKIFGPSLILPDNTVCVHDSLRLSLEHHLDLYSEDAKYLENFSINDWLIKKNNNVD